MEQECYLAGQEWLNQKQVISLTTEYDINLIPSSNGTFKPTAVFVPFKHFLNPTHQPLLFTEFFAPFQIVTEYSQSEVNDVLKVLEDIPHNLTASICSNDNKFVHHFLGNTINGVTYSGILSRTTGAPQNHYFGPSGDPRSSGIGTPEAIINMWTCHREVVTDIGEYGVEKSDSFPHPH